MDYTCGVAPTLRTNTSTHSSLKRSALRRSFSKFGLDTEIRQHLNEQLRCVDSRLDWEGHLLTDLQEYYQKRAQIEDSYARELKKLYVSHVEKLKTAERARRVCGGSEYSIFQYYQTLLGITHSLSCTHASLSHILQAKMAPRFQEIRENSDKMLVRCRDMIGCCHAEILRNVKALQVSSRSYQELLTAQATLEHKLSVAADELNSLLRKAKSSDTKITSLRLKVARRQEKFENARVKACKARNEYLLQLKVTNEVVVRYTHEEVSDLLDCLACGYHNSLSRACMQHLNCEEVLKQRQEAYVRLFMSTMQKLDARHDKAAFLEQNSSVFSQPKLFSFEKHKLDTVTGLEIANSAVQQQLEERWRHLQDSAAELRLQTQEIWKSLQSAEASWVQQLNQPDYFVRHLFNSDSKSSSHHDSLVEMQLHSLSTSTFNDFTPENSGEQRPAEFDRQKLAELADYYLSKYRHYLILYGQLNKLQTKAALIHQVLSADSAVHLSSQKLAVDPNTVSNVSASNTKIFGANLAALSSVPLPIVSCVRLICTFGMRHQGIFRIPGSQTDIARIKDSFQQGEDPFELAVDGKDINSACGVLKCYLRELEDPLLPLEYFQDFIQSTNHQNRKMSVEKLKAILVKVDSNVYRTQHFLFSFLNKLALFSEDNLMDSYNLSVCLGPSILPVPADKDPVLYQGPINDLVKILIDFSAEIFDQSGADDFGHVLGDERASSEDVDDEDLSIGTNELTGEGAAAEETASLSDDAEFYQVVAKYDFVGRTARELSFYKGETLSIFSRVTAEWLQGANSLGQEGLIPDTYVQVVEEEEAAAPAPAPTKHSSSRYQNRLSAIREWEQDEGAEGAAGVEVTLRKPKVAAEDPELRNIDMALKEVMAGLDFLSTDTDSPYADPQTILCSKVFLPSRHTPDLVLDLPSSSSADPLTCESSTLRRQRSPDATPRGSQSPTEPSQARAKPPPVKEKPKK